MSSPTVDWRLLHRLLETLERDVMSRETWERAGEDPLFRWVESLTDEELTAIAVPAEPAAIRLAILRAMGTGVGGDPRSRPMPRPDMVDYQDKSIRAVLRAIDDFVLGAVVSAGGGR